jgi:signal transduction histidine kinase
VGLLLWGLYSYQDANDEREESSDTLRAVDETMLAIVDAETGQRGYLLTGQDEFLEPYNRAVERIGTLLAVLEARLHANISQEAAFSRALPLIAERLALLATAVERRRNGEPVDLTAVATGNAVMDQLRSELNTIRDIEEQHSADRIDRAENLGLFLGATAIVLALSMIGITAWLWLFLRRRQEGPMLRAAGVAKDEFVGFVSHEIRGPTALITGNARLLADGTLSEEEQHQAAVEILGAGERLSDIVDTLLSLSKAESGRALEVEPILLHRIAQSVRRHHRSRFPEREVLVSLEGEVSPALGDRGAIEQVLINLLSNAEKYGDPKAPIAIVIASKGREALVSVINRGENLSPAELDHVFEPFFRMPASTAAAPGVGLGLTICHRLIAAQSGRMSAEAMPSGGARFSFTLPLAPLDDGS